MTILFEFFSQLSWIFANYLKCLVVSFVHIHAQYHGQLDPRAFKCVFVGYSITKKGYKCYHPTIGKIFTFTDVTFVEQESFFPTLDLHGETLMEENEDLTFLHLPITSPTDNIDTTNSQPTNSDPPLSPMSKSKGEIQEKVGPSITLPLQVYLRRNLLVLELGQVQDFDPITSTETSTLPLLSSFAPSC